MFALSDVRNSKKKHGSRWLYPALLAVIIIIALSEYLPLSAGPAHPSSLDSHGLRELLERAVTNPIVALLFLLGLLHAVEVTQRLTLSLLREVNEAADRIASSGREHNRELHKLLGKLAKRRPRRDPPSQ